MHPAGPAASFHWPVREDVCHVPFSHILHVIPTPTTDQYRLDEEIAKLFFRIMQDLMNRSVQLTDLKTIWLKISKYKLLNSCMVYRHSSSPKTFVAIHVISDEIIFYEGARCQTWNLAWMKTEYRPSLMQKLNLLTPDPHDFSER